MKTQSLEPDVFDQLFKLIRFLMRRPIYSIDGPGNGILDFDIAEIVRHRKSAVDVDIDADSLSVRAQRVNHCAFHSCGAYIWQKSALAAALDQKVIRREFFVQGDQRLGLEILNLKDRPAAEGVAVIDDGFHFPAEDFPLGNQRRVHIADDQGQVQLAGKKKGFNFIIKIFRKFCCDACAKGLVFRPE